MQDLFQESEDINTENIQLRSIKWDGEFSDSGVSQPSSDQLQRTQSLHTIIMRFALAPLLITSLAIIGVSPNAIPLELEQRAQCNRAWDGCALDYECCSRMCFTWFGFCLVRVSKP